MLCTENALNLTSARDSASGERRILVPTGAPRLRFLPACQPDRVNVHARLEIQPRSETDNILASESMPTHRLRTD